MKISFVLLGLDSIMKLYVVIRLMNHEADVEFHRVTKITDIEVTDYHQNNVEAHVVTICSQCVMPHVTGVHAVPLQQAIPIRCWCCDYYTHYSPF